MRRSSPKDQQGFLVITVVLVLAVLAAMALMISTSASLDNALVAKHTDSAALEYATKAGMAHAKWQLSQNTTCAAYATLPATPFGLHSYSATIAPTSGSPVSVAAQGTLANGAQRTLQSDPVTTYQASTVLTLQPDAAMGKDTRVYEWKSAWNYGTATTLSVENRIAGDWSNSLLEFDVSSIPAAAIIISATLVLNQSSPAASGGDFSVHRVTSPWVEGVMAGGNGSPNWDNRDTGVAWTTPGGDYDPTSIATINIPAGLLPHQWEVGALVQSWVSGKSDNYGLALVPASFGSDAFFHSSDATSAALRPSLEVTYACECGIAASSGSTVLQPGVLGKEATLRTNKNFGATPYTWIDTSVPYHSLYEFDLSGLPPGAVVTSALLEIHQSSADMVSVAANLDVNRATTAWVEGTGGISGSSPPDGATWETSDGTVPWTTVGGDYDAAVIDSVVINSTGTAWHQWDVTSLAQSWVDGTYPNFGFLLRASSGDLTKLYLDTGEDNATSVHPKLSISFDCPCGVTCVASPVGAPPPGTELLLVVGNATTLATQDSDKKMLIESWGYTVTLIDDNAAQTEFDTAVAASSVAYVSATVFDTTLNTKLVNTSIGVVSEKATLVDEFGFSTNRTGSNQAAVMITDNIHYITSVFSLGPLPLHSSQQPSFTLSGTLAAGLESLADGSGSEPGLAVLEVGASLAGGGTAAGRRVKLPWGGAAFDHSLMNSDGQTIMKRSIEWGATASGAATGPIAHWKLDDGAGLTALDSEGGHDGTLTTGGPVWVAGTIGDALNFDGANDYVDLTSDAELDDVFVGGATVMAWIEPAGWGNNGYGRIFDKSSSPSATGNGWALRMNVDNGGLNFGQGFTSGRGWWRFAESSLSLGSWQHIAVAYDASSTANDPVVYLNGSPVAVTRVDTPSGGVLSDAAINLHLGNHASSAATFFDGKIDDARVYDRMLNAAEIADIAAGGGGGGSGSSLYVETYQEWTPTEGSQWQVQDLSGFGVPPDAVVEVAVTNGNPNFERWVGLRAVGSVIDRRLQLTEAEADGEDVVVMHVQANSSSQIEHYAQTADLELRFVLLGYWTAGTYVERFDVFTAGTSTSWVNRNLAPYGVGPGSVAEIVMTNNNPSLEREAGVRTPGSGLNNRRVDLQEAENGGVDGATMMVVADGSANAAIQVAAEADADVDFHLVGYWSTPPGTYIEAAGPIFDPSSANSEWTVGDFSGSGAPANSTVQIAIMNGSGGREANLGVRAVGSSLERWLDLREAEAGGRDIAVWHVNFDGSSAIEFYDERTSEAHEFRVLGWWQ